MFLCIGLLFFVRADRTAAGAFPRQTVALADHSARPRRIFGPERACGWTGCG